MQGNPLDAGIRVCNGQGDNQLLGLLEALQTAALTFCGFADRDGANTGRWDALKAQMNNRLFQWADGCIESNVISVLPADYLEQLFLDAEGLPNGNRLRTVADRIGVQDKTIENILNSLGNDRELLRAQMIKAATGDTTDIVGGDEKKSQRKEWKNHAKSWFKISDGSGGRELVVHLQQSGSWAVLEPQLRPFFNEPLQLIGSQPVEQITI